LNTLITLIFIGHLCDEFNALQIIDDISIPNGAWNTNGIPEPITNTYPKYGSGGATQVITNKPIKKFELKELNNGSQ